MSEQAAYRSQHVDVLKAWSDYLDHVEEVNEKRLLLQDHYGRRLWHVSGGFGHGSRIVGFESLEGDTPESLPRELRFNKSSRRVEPYRQRKAGKDLDAYMRSLEIKGPELPGMPGWTIIGLHVLRPAINLFSGALYVLWSQEIEGHGSNGGVVNRDGDFWEKIPLSQYYAVREAHADELKEVGS